MGMAGLDEWITGHYGEDQYDDIYCPGCGANADKVGFTEVEGTFSSSVCIYKCDGCGHFVQDGWWFSLSEVREKFA